MSEFIRVEEALRRRNPPLCEKCGKELPDWMIHRCPTTNFGLPLKKGQLVEVDFVELKGIFRVERDVQWNADGSVWGSVKLEGVDQWFFTHKGCIKVL